MIGWGSNDFGQLALGTDALTLKEKCETGVKDKSSVGEPVEIPFFNPRRSNFWGAAAPPIKAVTCGANHSLFLTVDGIVYATGGNKMGQLGRAISDPLTTQASTPSKVENLTEKIKGIGSGSYHNLAITESGNVLCWGLNDKGQCGPQKQRDYLGPEQVIYTPRPLPGLGDSYVGFEGSLVAGGAHHSLILSRGGAVYVMGDNNFGQLGLGDDIFGGNLDIPFYDMPVELDELTGIPVTCIACGDHHCVVVSRSGDVFAWGSNARGQLGLDDVAVAHQPTRVNNLAGTVVKDVSCGRHHTVALSLLGEVFTFGAGDEGQLGNGSRADERTPRRVEGHLRGKTVTQVATGKHHTIVLEEASGKILGFGCAKNGVLGNAELLTSPSSSQHHHKSVPWKIKARFLTHSATEAKRRQQPVEGVASWFKSALSPGSGGANAAPSEDNDQEEYPENILSMVYEIFSGGSHCFASTFGVAMVPTDAMTAFSRWRVDGGDHIPAEWTKSQMKVTSSLQQRSATLLGIKFAKRSSLGIHVQANESMTMDRPATSYPVTPFPMDRRLASEFASPIATVDAAAMRKVAKLTSSGTWIWPSAYKLLKKSIVEVFQSTTCINASFLLHGRHHLCDEGNPGLDIPAVRTFFNQIKSNFKDMQEEICSALAPTLYSLSLQRPISMENLRIFLILPESNLLKQPGSTERLLVPYAEAFANLGPSAKEALTRWYNLPEIGYDHLMLCLETFKTAISETLKKLPLNRLNKLQLEAIKVMLDAIKVIYDANVATGQEISYAQFYIPEIGQLWEMNVDYLLWQLQRQGSPLPPEILSMMPRLPFFFCNYPFVLDGVAKATVLQADAHYQMAEASAATENRNLVTIISNVMGEISGPVRFSNPYLVVLVKREQVLQDAVQVFTKGLQSRGQIYKRPLVVIFNGEEAVDNGGVKKEFFMIIFKELLDQNYGMFLYYEESRLLWFNHHSLEEEEMFYLVGLLCGLAIYNSIIISLNFPLVLYRLLLNPNAALSVDDLDDLDPTTARSLRELLEFEEENESFEETFFLSFEVTEDYFGDIITVNLKPGGEDIPVTIENREEYVELYLETRLKKSVEVQLKAFRRGFLNVCGGQILELFQPKELMEMVIGNENYDFTEFQTKAHYGEPFHKDHETIKWFWEIFQMFTEDQKRKFLLFLTASDRVPVQGMAALPIFICANNGGDAFFPVAHTCINRLDLPIYSNKKILEEKLLIAIEHVQGFGLA